MPPWLMLVLFVLGCTLTVPLFVLGNTGGNWREALRAWRFFALVLLGLASPYLVVHAWLMLMRP